MVPSVISHYTILEKLGEGGMGVVYKAQDLKLGRTVAIKFLPQRYPANREDRDRFSREAQSVSALNHPNICTIHEIDEAEGELFIVMEFIEGRSLRKAIEPGPLTIAEAIQIALNVTEGLCAAHGKMIVHKDIKPENIIITGEGFAKIVDFGLAQTSEPASGSETNLVAGTIAYMSPEQLRGDQVNHLTDIWSLGIVLYEVVTGHRPFGSEYVQAEMYAIAHEKHRPASALRPDIPATFENIIDRCLEKLPGSRFPDARTLRDELRKINHGSTVTREVGPKSIAVLPFADISPEKDNMYFSDGLAEEIIANLSKLRKVKIVSSTSVMHYERSGKSMKKIASELGVQYVLEGSVRKHGSDLRITTQLIDASEDVLLWAEKYDGTMDEIFDIQENVAARIVKALRIRLTPDEKRSLRRRATENTEAYQLYLKGRFFWNKRNKDALQTAIRYFEEAIEKDPLYALAWAGMSDSYYIMSEYGNIPRKEIYSKARVAVQKALECDDKLAEAHTSLASLIMLSEWDWPGAEKEFKLAISLKPNYATAHHWYAEWLSFQGRIGQAVNEISLAAELDPVSPAILKDKGMILYYARDYDGAIEHAKKAQELDQDCVLAHRLLSLAYQGKGMFNEAIAENKRWGDLVGNGLETSIALSQCYAAAGNSSEALRLIENLTPEELPVGNMFRGIALVYAALGAIDLAFTWLEGAYEKRAEALSTLKIDPKLDRLRADPRFSALLKKTGLET